MSVVLAPEQEELRQAVSSLMEEFVAPRAEEIDAAGEFPEDVRRLFTEHDVFAVVAPPEYGGLDGSLLTLTMVCEEITRVCANSGMVLGNQYLGPGRCCSSAPSARRQEPCRRSRPASCCAPSP